MGSISYLLHLLQTNSGPPSYLYSERFRCVPKTCGLPCGRLDARMTERTGHSAALVAHRAGSPHARHETARVHYGPRPAHYAGRLTSPTPRTSTPTASSAAPT